MAIITGTTATDILIGTAEADILKPMGTTNNNDREVLRGLDGGDTYDLVRNGTAGNYNFLIDDRGSDGAVDQITNVGALYQSASLGYSSYATGVRVGGNLIIHTPSKPHRFHDPAKPDCDIKIKDQYSDGHIETMQAGGITYNLVMGSIGTAMEDFMAGTNQADSFSSGAGNDWVFGNGGKDVLNVGAGDDIVFGGNGGDTITAESGNNLIFGEAGNDRITTGDGADRIEGANGNDRVFAGAGNDRVDGAAGNDILKGQAGEDTLVGGVGNDRLIGGKGNDVLDAGAGDDQLIGNKGGDTYIFSASEAGINTIIDKGDAPLAGPFATAGDDVIRLNGVSAWMQGIDLEISGDDLVIYYETTGTAADQIGQITIQDHFLGVRFAIEDIAFGASSLAGNFHIVNLSGDNSTFSVHSGPDAGGNDIVLGTSGDDELYGGIGNNIYLAGSGADIFIFKDEEDNRGGLDRILDFDLTQDTLDFTEIKALSLAGLTIADNAFGNAEISSAFGTIELVDVAASEVTADIFAFV